MEAGDNSFGFQADASPEDILQQFIVVFSTRGWLGKDLHVRYRDRKYRFFCSRDEFLAYRVNDGCGISPGIPGWPVCVVTLSHIAEDAHLSGFASTEPSAYEWLAYIAEDKLEII